MTKPYIGIVPLYDEHKDSYWMLPGYMKGIEQAGGIPVMLPLTNDPETLKDLAARFDGFLFTGGHDLGPDTYGEEPHPEAGTPCPERDTMEAALLRHVLDWNKPAFGICRGLQFFHVYFGGTLYQDLPSQRFSDVVHKQKPPYDVPVHTVDINEGSPLSAVLGTGRIRVNSYHHQAVKLPAAPLETAAVSPDGLIEASWHPAYTFCLAVQWHPEFSWQSDEHSRKLFHAFVQASCPAASAL
ncbi:gamma-glutamyl-gamma-aminobutyrate hydrolase family protein [Alkalicoccus urumqiensis]|uniref:Amidotransferase n=1 Tax=Alkalicoccus urumqiensis TaxID=1548213 RepID=A0A2P6MJS8_ALKUR|nr:gamma-glutamyl-gamma-aminobutyrate hydrolase family protein [Alkalicoccus urumqiensis]PRO66523.1 amidotransferase [Alkalicoccus urumqiensis]